VCVSAMLFEHQKSAQTFDERLALLLGEQPVRVSVLDVKHHHPYDHCRALVVGLLITSVAGTWSLAYFL
jgi:hypothetical protein